VLVDGEPLRRSVASVSRFQRGALRRPRSAISRSSTARDGAVVHQGRSLLGNAGHCPDLSRSRDSYQPVARLAQSRSADSAQFGTAGVHRGDALYRFSHDECRTSLLDATLGEPMFVDTVSIAGVRVLGTFPHRRVVPSSDPGQRWWVPASPICPRRCCRRREDFPYARALRSMASTSRT